MSSPFDTNDGKAAAVTGSETRQQKRASAALPPQDSRGSRRISSLPTFESYALFVVWIAIIVTFSIVDSASFATMSNVSTILGSQTTLLLLALGIMIPLTVGEFDLSIAYNMVVGTVVIGWLNVNQAVPILVAVIAGVAACCLVGFINAILVVRVGIPSLIATLGTGTFFGGVALWITDSQSIGGVSPGLVRVVIGLKLFSIPLAFYFGVLVTLGLWVIYQFTTLGKRLLFVGRGPDVARLAGIRVDRVRVSSLTAAGFLAGLSAVITVGSSGSASPTAYVSLLLPAFAAVFLGSTVITPGRHNPIGTFAAVYFLVTGISGLQLTGFGTYVQNLFYGGALIVAVSFSVIARRRNARKPLAKAFRAASE